mgnify:CR=1 FL=1
MNSTPFVRQYDIMSNRWGDFNAKGSTKQTIHAGIQEAGRGNHDERKMSYRETARQFEISNHHRVQDWERIYLTRVQKVLPSNGVAAAVRAVRQSRCRSR